LTVGFQDINQDIKSVHGLCIVNNSGHVNSVKNNGGGCLYEHFGVQVSSALNMTTVTFYHVYYS